VDAERNVCSAWGPNKFLSVGGGILKLRHCLRYLSTMQSVELVTCHLTIPSSTDVKLFSRILSCYRYSDRSSSLAYTLYAVCYRASNMGAARIFFRGQSLALSTDSFYSVFFLLLHDTFYGCLPHVCWLFGRSI